MMRTLISPLVRKGAASALLVALLAGCADARSAAPPTAPVASPTLAPVPTLPPTKVPGSVADEEDVTRTVQQFGKALAQDDDTVALLVLSPSAQQIVASSNLVAFLGEANDPETLTVQRVRLDGDVAIAEGTIRSGDQEHPIVLQLVRMEGVWKINGRVGN